MGFEISIVVVIFIISLLFLGTTTYTSLDTSNDLVDDATMDRYDIENKRLHTDVSIDQLTYDGNNHSYNLTVTITNRGNQILYSGEADVLIDGVLRSHTYEPSNNIWTPEETKYLSITGLSGEGTHRIKVITDTGVPAYGVYNI